jgi:hypothetical protein
MNPNEIDLDSISKLFEYEKIAREIDSCENPNELRNIAKSYLKLYFKQQEVISTLGMIS